MCMVTWLQVHKYSLTSVDIRQFLDLKMKVHVGL